MEKRSEKGRSASTIFRIFRFALVLAVSAAIAYGLVNARKKPEKQQVERTPPVVSFMEAQPKSTVMTVEAFGTVKARKQVIITAEVSGIINYIHPSFIGGGQIKKGELLIRIDQRSYRLDRESAQVKVKQATVDIESLEQDIVNLKQDIELSKANMLLARKELERVKALSKNQFASKTMLDKAEQQYLQAKIALQNLENRLVMTAPAMEQKKAAFSMAKVNFEKADLAFKKTRIVAPFDGWVIEKLLETGEYAVPGKPIGSIYEQGGLDVDISIPIEHMKWIEPVLQNGQMPAAKISLPGSENPQACVWPAKVARFKANIDEKTRTLAMTIEIGNETQGHEKGFNLKPGAFVKCCIDGAVYGKVFVVPRHLLKTGERLFIVNDSHLKIKPVQVLRKLEHEVIINGGLAAGDKIIDSPLPGAVEGMALTIKESGE